MLLCLALAGCGDAEAPASSVAVNKPAAAPGAPDPTANMAMAVTPGQGSGAVDLKFRVLSRPVPNEPLDIDLALIPREASQSLRLIVQNTDGLRIVSGQELPAVKGAVPGVALMHRLTLRPTSDGVYTVSAVALIDSATASITRTFSIPLIVGTGVGSATAQ